VAFRWNRIRVPRLVPLLDCRLQPRLRRQFPLFAHAQIKTESLLVEGLRLLRQVNQRSVKCRLEPSLPQVEPAGIAPNA
jgi:hypothetical protein